MRARSLLTLLPRTTDATGAAPPLPARQGGLGGGGGSGAHAQSGGRAEAHVAHGAAAKGGATFRA